MSDILAALTKLIIAWENDDTMTRHKEWDDGYGVGLYHAADCLRDIVNKLREEEKIKHD